MEEFEVDEAALDVGGDELDLHALADVELRRAAGQHPLDRRREGAHPGVVVAASGDDGVVALADMRFEQQRGLDTIDNARDQA